MKGIDTFQQIQFSFYYLLLCETCWPVQMVQRVLTVPVRSWVDLVDHGLSQSLQHLLLVIVKVSVDLVDCAVLHYPQLALSLCDEPGIVTHNDHSWTRRGTTLVLS